MGSKTLHLFHVTFVVTLHEQLIGIDNGVRKHKTNYQNRLPNSFSRFVIS